MLQYLAQGAGQAEDAVVPARNLRYTEGNVLRRFKDTSRRLRCGQAWRTARLYGDITTRRMQRGA
jgi:hypothetical protein